MNIENMELAILAIALLLTTANIFVYSWFETHEKYLRVGIWVVRIGMVLPGLVALVWSMYIMATGNVSTLSKTLLTAGVLLVAGAIQLLSLLLRKQPECTGKAG